MSKEERTESYEDLFVKLFPEYVAHDRPLHPFVDLFEAGYAQAEIRYDNAVEIVKKLLYLYYQPIVTNEDLVKQDEIIAEAKSFIEKNK